jgi:hypothetical protein
LRDESETMGKKQTAATPISTTDLLFLRVVEIM